MKYILPLISSLLIIGCSDSTPAKAPETPQQITTQSTSPALEANKSSTEASAPEEPNTTATQTIPTPTPPVSSAATTAMAPIDGGILFGQKCSACHGSKAEKSALGKSQIIVGWKESQTKDALKGYQAGTYGKEMKAVMQGQAKGLNDAQIDALAKYISSL